MYVRSSLCIEWNYIYTNSGGSAAPMCNGRFTKYRCFELRKKSIKKHKCREMRWTSVYFCYLVGSNKQFSRDKVTIAIKKGLRLD